MTKINMEYLAKLLLTQNKKHTYLMRRLSRDLIDTYVETRNPICLTSFTAVHIKATAASCFYQQGQRIMESEFRVDLNSPNVMISPR